MKKRSFNPLNELLPKHDGSSVAVVGMDVLSIGLVLQNISSFLNVHSRIRLFAALRPRCHGREDKLIAADDTARSVLPEWFTRREIGGSWSIFRRTVATELTQFNNIVQNISLPFGKFLKVKEAVLGAMKHKSSKKLLKKLHASFRDDRDIVLAAVQKHRKALSYASMRLRSSKEVVLAALHSHPPESGCVFKYASESLRDDKEIALIAMRKAGSNLQYASSTLQNDFDVVLAAVQSRTNQSKYQSEWSLQYSSMEMQSNREVVKEAVKIQGMQLYYASWKLRNDLEIVHIAIRQNPNARFTVPVENGTYPIWLRKVEEKIEHERLEEPINPPQINSSTDEEFLEMDDAALDEAIEKWQKVEDEANEHFTTEIKKLQEKYEELKDDKEWVLQNALDTGLKVARQVRSHRSPKKAAAAEGGASFLAPLAPFAPLIVMLLLVVVVYFVFYHNQSLEPAIKLTEKEKARLRKKQMKKDKKRGSN
eukprot:g6265.t1